MLDKHEIDRINEVARKNIENASEYAKARRISAKAKFELDVLVAKAYMDKELDPKMAYEKSLVLLGNKSPENQAIYKKYSDSIAIYKGLEKVIEANQSQIMLAQSVMKYQLNNT